MSKKKKILLIVLLSIIGIGIIMTLSINIYMVNSTKKQIIAMDKIEEINDIDYILILGCKTEDDKPSVMLSNRLATGVLVYNKLKTKILVSGDNTRDDYDEVNIMEKYLNNLSVDSSDIIKDYAGISTYDSIYRAKNIFNAKKIVIITQEYHLYRALYIANSLDLDAIGVVADDVKYPFIMLKNKIREVFSRDKNFFKVLSKPESKYLDNNLVTN